MPLSYSGITNYGKTNLPSVEGWGTNLNILRDPPKSIYTRKIDKVGETSSITQMIEESGDRSCEAIQVYARGVNPFVGVTYSNNGGGQAGNLKQGGVTQSKLPYRVMREGAFRPPILRQEDLLPISRMPRVWTHAKTQPGFSDYSKKLHISGTDKETKEVKDQLLKGCIRPTAVYKIETPLSKPFEVKYVIQPTVLKSVNSGIRTTDRTQSVNKNPTREVNYKNIHVNAGTNLSNSRNYENFSSLETDRFIQDINLKNVNTNMRNTKHHTNIEDVLDLSYIPINENIPNISHDITKTGYNQNNYIHENINLERKIPTYNAHTNAGKNIGRTKQHTNDVILKRNTPFGSYNSNPTKKGESNVSSREYRLNPTINKGGFNIQGQLPSLNRIQNEYENFESEKSKFSKSVYKQMEGRFGNPYVKVK